MSREGAKRRMEERERTERAQLEGAQLVARTIAHELNNVLSPITGYAELLTIRPAVRDDPVAISYARLIGEAADLAAAKVRQLQGIVRLARTDDSDATVPSILDLDRSTRRTPPES